MKKNYAALMTAAVLLCTPAFAQEDGDVPEQGVARLSLINGDVKVRQGESGEETAGVVNAPILTGDRVFTAGNARAELQFDFANIIRMGPMAEVTMGQIADRHYEVHLTNGLVIVRVQRDNQAQFEIDTPSVSVRPSRRGSYRIAVLEDGSTEITVRSGEAEIFSPQGSERLGPGQTMLTRGDPANPEFQTVTETARDEFDQWSDSRDREMDRSISSRYVPSDVYGTESLDGYGNWTYDAPYGWVWVPQVDAGWAPYREGRWSYVNYYGWTWISADPWGWAPYHYGRWYQGNRGWAWYPGAIGPRYYWRPALVGFFGWGSGGIGIGFGNTWGFGNVGWVPLAPFEVYRPWYGRWGGGNRYTVVNNINVTNVYRNARFNGGYSGITSVRGNDFGRGSIRGNNFVRANERDLRNVGEARGGVPFQPGNDSRRFSDRSVNNASFPRDQNRQVFRSANAPRNVGSRGFTGGNQGGNPNDGGNRGFGRSQNPAGNNANGAPIFRGGPADNGNGRVRDNSVNANPQGNAQNGNRGWRTFDPNANQNPNPQGNRGGFDRNAIPNGGAPAARAVDPAQQNNRGGGWRTFDPNGPRGNDRGRALPSAPQTAPQVAPQVRSFDPGADRGRPARSFDPSYDRGSMRSAPQQSAPPAPRVNYAPRTYNPAPVQINPPIVRDRGNFGGGARVQQPQQSAPRMENRGGGGGFGAARSAPSGGGGGGNRGGGGGGNRGGRGR